MKINQVWEFEIKGIDHHSHPVLEPVKHRADKQEANFYKTVENVMQAYYENITPAEILRQVVNTNPV